MASAKKRIVQCQSCHRIMKACTDVEVMSESDHLYVMSASNNLLPGLVKIGRSKKKLFKERLTSKRVSPVIECCTHVFDPKDIERRKSTRSLRASG